MRNIHIKISAIVFIAFISIMCVLCLHNNRSTLFSLIKGLNEETIFDLDVSTDSVLSNGFPYKEAFIEINGIENLLLGRKAIEDSNVTVIMDSNHRLHTIAEQVPEDTISSEITNVTMLNDFLSNRDVPFFYVQAPFKADTNKADLPYGIEDFSRENADVALKMLQDGQVPVIDLRQELNGESLFFNTDHHWRIEAAFEAAQVVAARLCQMPNLAEIEDNVLSNLENYDIQVEPNAYLGSLGRRTSAAYAGKDDFSYIIPKFDTAIDYVHKKEGKVVLEKAGDFQTALISDPAQSDYYCSYLNNSYCEMIVENRLAANDKKLLVISDSFGRPFSAYISLYFKTTVNVDTQEGRFKENIFEYIQAYKPDAVIALFNSGMYEYEDVFQFGNPNSIMVYCPEKALDVIEAKEIYTELLNSVTKGSHGAQLHNALESAMTESHQQIAYLLKAEVLRYSDGEKDAEEFIRAAVNFLLEHSDDNGDGESGWGLNEPWDAFSDGSENPENHVYAIQISNVLDALMDALKTDVLNGQERERVTSVMREITLAWHEKYWTQNAEEGECFYWYSISRSDMIECSNISAKMAGTFARCCKMYSALFSDQELANIWEKIHLTMRRLAEEALVTQEYDCLFWGYSQRRKESPNDAIHHAFIVEGIEAYKTYRTDPSMLVPWSEADMLAYLYMCLDNDNGFLYSYPEHTSYRMFDAGAIPLFKHDPALQGKMLMNMLTVYHLNGDVKVPADEDERIENGYTDAQLPFLMYALSDYVWGE